MPRGLPINFIYAVPPPTPTGVIKCLSYSVESVSKMYQLSWVSSCHLWDYICPTDQFNFDGRADIIVFQTRINELLHLSYFSVLEIQFLASINDMQSMVRANNGVHYGLKVVFACLHISLSPSPWVDWLQRINKTLANYILSSLSLR